MPLRDDRQGRRATLGFGKGPLRPDFGTAAATRTKSPEAANATAKADTPALDPRTGDLRTSDLRTGSRRTDGPSSYGPSDGPSSSRVDEDSVHTDNAHTDNVHTGNGHTGNVHTDDVHTGNVHTDDVHADNVNTGNVHMGNVHTGDVHMGSVRTGDVHTGNVHTGNVREEAVRKYGVPIDGVPANDVRTESGGLAPQAVYSADGSRASTLAREDERSGPSAITLLETTSLVNQPRLVAQPSSLLEPADVLVAIARPFLEMRSAIMRFVNIPINRSRSGLTHDAVDDNAAPTIDERPFATQVASLLHAPIEAVASSERMEGASPSHHDPAEPFALRDSGSVAPARRAAVSAPSNAPAKERLTPETPAGTRSRLDETAKGDAPHVNSLTREEPAESTEAGNSGRRTRDDVNVNDSNSGATRTPINIDDSNGDAARIDDSNDGRCGKRGTIVSKNYSEQNIVIGSMPARLERAVPITRLPLRPQGFEITWPAEVPEFERAGSLSRTARLQLLEGLVRNPGAVPGDAIARAYHQEEGEGRTIALRVLLRNFPHAGRGPFIEALRVGSDEERSLAVDGLTAIGAREEMTSAFSDRVDAVAAKAALSYVGTLKRADYRAELSRFIDESRIEAILKLLAGIVE